MIRVLSVQHYPTFGGPYNEILQLNEPLRDRGVTTVVVMTDEPGTAHARLSRCTEVRTLQLSRLRRVSDLRVQAKAVSSIVPDVARLRATIRREKVDLVKVHGPHNPHGAFAAHLEGVPVVWVVSSAGVPRVFQRVGVSLVDRYAAAVLVTGRSLLDNYPGGRRLCSRSFVYYPPVDTTVFKPASSKERAAVRQELGVPASAQLVGTVANINPHKGIAEFVRMAAYIHQREPQTRFAVVGAAATSQRAYYKRVRQEVTRLGLQNDAISWLGARSDVARLMGAFDVKVISSVSEGTPTTASEAMSCEVPLVSTNVGAVEEVIQHGRTGYIVKDNKISSLADAVLELLASDELRAFMGNAGRRHAKEHLGLDHCADAHHTAYRFALKRSH